MSAAASAESLSFALEPLGSFSLEAAARFWGGFTPATHTGLDAAGHLHMAFPADGSWQPAGVCLRDVDGQLTATVYGNSPDLDLEAIQRQTTRILSVDVDGRAFPDIAQRDPIAGELIRHHPGLRPVCFYSPYEAAAWCIISHRINKRQAAPIKERLSVSLGATIDIHGQPMLAFPSPSALLDLDAFPGLFGRKAEYLRAIAQAALDGRLDAARLHALPDAEALSALQELPGIGPFGAQLILLRACGHPDYLTLIEPRFRQALGAAYNIPNPTDADLERIADNWRPFRMWVTFLLRQHA